MPNLHEAVNSVLVGFFVGLFFRGVLLWGFFGGGLVGFFLASNRSDREYRNWELDKSYFLGEQKDRIYSS